MKILSATQIYEADSSTIDKQAISSSELMERAAAACFNWISQQFPDRSRAIHVYCGMGNNGGDGLVISRMLLESGFKVHVYLINFSEKRSEDFTLNLRRLKKQNTNVKDISSENDFTEISERDLVIDCIFGIGLKRSPAGFTKQIIDRINGSGAEIVSIDIPSGLFSEAPVTDRSAVIRADFTLTFQVPKLAFFLPDNEIYTGKWTLIDIGLDEEYIRKADSKYCYADIVLQRKFFKKRSKFSHKGTFGHSLLIGGSFGKIGAISLASKAALKAGSGLVTAYVPKCGYSVLQTAVPEAMVEVDDEHYLQYFNFKTTPTSIGIGPGLGMHLKTKKGFVDFFSNCKLPLVIDADGLNIIAEYKDLSDLIPVDTILTPHPKEFERLAGKWKNDFEKLQLLDEYSARHKCVVVLKGAHTAISYQGKVWFNSSGNPALATAGSGDVLTGIITSLLSQGYSCLEASILGVYIHGRAADIAVSRNESQESLIASDLSEHLGKVFKELY